MSKIASMIPRKGGNNYLLIDGSFFIFYRVCALNIYEKRMKYQRIFNVTRQIQFKFTIV